MESPALEEPPVFLRVFEQPKRTRVTYALPNERPNDHLTIVLDTETTTDTRQDLRFGVAQVYAEDRLTRTILFKGQVGEAEGRTISAWAETHRAEVLTVERFVTEVFLPLAVDMRAVVVGFNLPFDLSRIAADWEPKRKIAGKDAWTLWLLPRANSKAAYTPRIRVQRVDSTKGFIGFTGTKGRWRKFRGAFVDLRTFVHALTGEKHSLKSAGEAFGCSLKKTEADYHGPVTGRYLEYCRNDVSLTWELYERCRGRYRDFGLTEHPSRIYSPASLAKSALRARGIVPPTLPPDLTGRLMAAFYGGKVECRVVGREVEDVAVLDFTSQYPSLYCLLDAERFLTAERIEARNTTEEVRTWVDSLTVEALLGPESWRDSRMWTLCEVEADGEILPLRSTYSGPPADAPTIGWNHVTTERCLTLPYMLADLLAAQLLGGKLPKIVRATTIEPKGKQELRPLTILGTKVGPEDDLIRVLTEARIREKKEKQAGWEARALGLKIVANSGSYGIFVEVNRKRKAGEATIHGLDGDPFDTEETELEEPGVDYCPLLAAVLTSAAHLLLALVDSVVASAGGEAVYCDTDSAFVSPSKVAGQVAERFDSLSPYSERVALLKDETEEKAPRSEYPMGSPDMAPHFFGLSAKRYCLFARDKSGWPHVFRKAASDHGLGSFEVTEDREEFVVGVWEAILTDCADAPDSYSGIPATAPFSLSSPALLPRVRKLGPIRPFTFLTARFLEPSPDPTEDRSELVAFVPTKDGAARTELMQLPRQRSWGSVLEAFVRHRDRKCHIDGEGRMSRRRVLVRKSRIIGLGKEANRIETGRVLGQVAVGGRSKTYVNWKGRLLAMGRAEAKRLGLPWATVMRWKRRLRSGLLLVNGHGGRACGRLQEVFLAQPSASAESASTHPVRGPRTSGYTKNASMVSRIVCASNAMAKPGMDTTGPPGVSSSKVFVAEMMPRRNGAGDPSTTFPLTIRPGTGLSTTGLPLEPGMIAPSTKNAGSCRERGLPSSARTTS